MSGTQGENPPPPPPQETQQTPTQQTPQTVSTIKLPILKKGEYDIWAMKIEHYLAHTDYPIWEVIQNGNGPVSVTTDTSGQIKILPPKIGEEVVARERERKARTTLLMAIPEDHLAKFHKMTDAKEMWNAIKSRFGGNDESKKMQKYILKQQFEGFTVSNTDGIHKGYERFQSLLSQLEIHGAGVSTEDANQKFLRSLPSAWLQVSLIMRNKPGMDSLSFDDLYNNLRVFENDVKGSTASTSNLQNIAFVSENTNSTNDVSTAYGVSNTSGHNSKLEQTSSYSLLASQSSCPQLDHEDLDQVDEYDLEEMDLKWQVAMISMRIKKFYKKTGRKLQFDAKEPVGFDKTKVECYNCHKTGHFARECRTKEDNRRRDGWNPGNKDGSRTGKKEESKALVTVDGESVDWTTHSEDDENYAFMASNSSGSDTQREQLSDASVEIKAYTQGLKKVEAQLVAHQQGQLWYEQKIKFMKIDLDDKTDVLTYHKKLLAKAQKEKDDLEVIVDKWNHSSKNLGKIVNHHMSARDKFGLGYGDYRYSGILSYENEVFQSVFKSNKSDFENPPLNKRLVKTCEMQAVPPPMTGNYLPSGPDIEIDDSQYTYGPEKSQPSEPESQTTELDTCDSNISTEPSELVSEPVVNESNVEVQPKVWSDAPIIEEYESDSDDECVTVQTKGNVTPSFANKQVKTPRENVKNQSTHSQKPKVNNKELGNEFSERACFVCGSFSHLIRDCDYHVKLAKQVELNKQNMSKGNGTGERKPTWNNVHRVNKQNQFVPLAVQTRTGNNPVNTAKASSTKKVSTARQKVNRQTVLTSTALKVKTFKPNVNDGRPANVFHKTHSPSSRPFKRTTVLKTNFSNQKVYTVKVKEVSTVGEKWVTAVKSSAGCKWRTPGYNNNILSKYNGGSNQDKASPFGLVSMYRKNRDRHCAYLPVASISRKERKTNMEQDKPHRISKEKGIIDIDVRHMTGNKSLPADFKTLWWPCCLGVIDNGTDFKNSDFLNSVAKSDQEGIQQCQEPTTKWSSERKNRTLIEAARTMLADSFLPTLFGLSKNQANIHAGQQESNHNTGTKDKINAGDSEKEDEFDQDCFELPIWHSYSSTNKSASKSHKKRGGPREEEQVFLDDLARLQRQEKEANKEAEALRKNIEQETKNLVTQARAAKSSSTNIFSTVSTTTKASEGDSEIPPLEDIHEDATDGIFTHSSYDDEGAEADFKNLETIVNVSPIPTSRINPSHPSALILGDRTSAVQTRSKVNKSSKAHAFVSYVQKQRRNNHEDIHHFVICLFLSQHNPMKISEALKMKAGLIYQEECCSLRFKSPKAWYATLSTFLLKNGYRRGTIDKTLFLKKDKHDIILVQVYVDDIIFGSTKKSWCDEFEALMKSRFQMSSMGELTFFLGLQVKQKPDGTTSYEMLMRRNSYSGSSVDERGKTHHGKSNLFQETPKPLCSTFLPTDVKHCLNVGYTFVNFTTSKAVWKSHVCITRKSWPLFKSKKIAQVVCAWIQSKNSLVKHFEDMRLCRPSKEYLPVWFDPPRDESMSCLTTKGMRNNGAMCARKVMLVNALRRFRESLRRVTDALISLTDDLSLLSNMAALESCPKHNMIAYLEKTEGNVEFHEVIDFLRRSYIYHALTVSPVVSTTFVEQFWTSAKSKTINNVRHITAKVAGKFVSISEASIRTDLIFDDADGIDSLPNQAIFDAIQLMGYEGDLTVLTFNKALFSPQWRYHLSNNLTFHQVLHPDLHQTLLPTTLIIPDSIPEPTGENLGDHSFNDTSLSGNEDAMTLQNVYGSFIIFVTDEQMESNDDQVDASEEIFEDTEDQREGTEEKVESTVPKSKKESTERSKTKRKKLGYSINKTTASKEKEKGIELKDVEDTNRPRPTSTRSTLTLKPLPKIDPKDKGKKKIEKEDETERKCKKNGKLKRRETRLLKNKQQMKALIQDIDDIESKKNEADRILG
ncbi:ribonuclease H-like domain-containing protein [Tanacetum coccineum]